jgi:hypothetical protein
MSSFTDPDSGPGETGQLQPVPPPATLDAPQPRPHPRVGAWVWWVLRTVLTLQALDAFLQPVLAGRFLSGDFAMLALHRQNGTYVGGLSMAVLVLTFITWRLYHVQGRVVAGLGVLGPIAGLQIFLGFARSLSIHIPLGVAFIALSGWLMFWVWTHQPAPRPSKRVRQ